MFAKACFNVGQGLWLFCFSFLWQIGRIFALGERFLFTKDLLWLDLILWRFRKLLLENFPFLIENVNIASLIKEFYVLILLFYVHL